MWHKKCCELCKQQPISLNKLSQSQKFKAVPVVPFCRMKLWGFELHLKFQISFCTIEGSLLPENYSRYLHFQQFLGTVFHMMQSVRFRHICQECGFFNVHSSFDVINYENISIVGKLIFQQPTLLFQDFSGISF